MSTPCWIYETSHTIEAERRLDRGVLLRQTGVGSEVSCEFVERGLRATLQRFSGHDWLVQKFSDRQFLVIGDASFRHSKRPGDYFRLGDQFFVVEDPTFALSNFINPLRVISSQPFYSWVRLSGVPYGWTVPQEICQLFPFGEVVSLDPSTFYQRDLRFQRIYVKVHDRSRIPPCQNFQIPRLNSPDEHVTVRYLVETDHLFCSCIDCDMNTPLLVYDPENVFVAVKDLLQGDNFYLSTMLGEISSVGSN